MRMKTESIKYFNISTICMELRMYKFRIYPSNKQKVRLLNNLKICKQVYNELLELSINTYKTSKKTLRKYDFNKHLSGNHKEAYSQVIQNVSDRVSKAFSNFFRRVKENAKEKGFPRFKSRIKSITYPQNNGAFKFLNNKRLKVSKIGSIPIVLHRVPKGKIKTLTIKVNKTNQWFAIFSCEIEIPSIKHSFKEQIGIDIGLEHFATLSNGETIDNPRFLVKSEKKLKRLQRRLSRKKKGSNNRRKARFRVAKYHIKIANQRTDFLHKLSRNFSIQYGTIAVENLNIKGMVKNHHLAKQINDASWNNFIQMLSYKAVISGGQLIKVNPRGTSSICSNCGTKIKMPLSRRKFKCPKCKIVLHRDFNSALNIQGRAGLVQTSTPVGDTVRPSLKARVVEAGTIHNNS